MMTMQKKMAATFAALAGVGVIAAGSLTATPAAAQITLPVVVRSHAAHGEKHPEIRRALKNLNQAKNNLQKAAHDFGGHREQALDLVQRAIDQCQQALADDKH